MKSVIRSGCILAALLGLPASSLRADVPDSIAAKGETLIAMINAQGAQIYECKAGVAGTLEWQFREPIATLIADGETIGSHYAGPHWELSDGSKILGKVTGRVPGEAATDIPLLRLEAAPQNRLGLLADITTIQRLNTKGGVAKGTCEKSGALLSVAYSADYAFYRKLRGSFSPGASRNIAEKPGETR